MTWVVKEKKELPRGHPYSTSWSEKQTALDVASENNKRIRHLGQQAVGAIACNRVCDGTDRWVVVFEPDLPWRVAALGTLDPDAVLSWSQIYRVESAANAVCAEWNKNPPELADCKARVSEWVSKGQHWAIVNDTHKEKAAADPERALQDALTAVVEARVSALVARREAELHKQVEARVYAAWVVGRWLNWVVNLPKEDAMATRYSLLELS